MGASPCNQYHDRIYTRYRQMPHGLRQRKTMEEDGWKVRLRRRKLNIRFDEGELEIGQHHYASSLLYPILGPNVQPRCS
jgi:hypothetical protein